MGSCSCPVSVGWSQRMDPPCLVVSETDEDKSEKDETPLWRLAEAGDLDRVKMALTAEAEVNETGPGGSTPLMLAVGGRHNAVAWLLLLHPELDPNVQDDHGFTALHLACGRDNPWAVARIGRHPAFNSINAVDEEGCTALMEAATFGHTECMRTMLSLPGVQIGLKDGLGRGLEEIARGYPETLQAIKAVKQERAPFQRSISEAPRKLNEEKKTEAQKKKKGK